MPDLSIDSVTKVGTDVTVQGTAGSQVTCRLTFAATLFVNVADPDPMMNDVWTTTFQNVTSDDYVVTATALNKARTYVVDNSVRIISVNGPETQGAIQDLITVAGTALAGATVECVLIKATGERLSKKVTAQAAGAAGPGRWQVELPVKAADWQQFTVWAASVL